MSSTKKPDACPHCGKPFVNPKQMMTHYRVCKGKRS